MQLCNYLKWGFDLVAKLGIAHQLIQLLEDLFYLPGLQYHL